MLRALLPAAVAAMTFSAHAYEGPQPGDLALSDDMCHEVCDVSLDATDEIVIACHGLCDEIKNCRMNQSHESNKFNDCVSNANRKFSLIKQGHSVRSASALSEGDKVVVTDADNFRVEFEEDGQKGFRDAR